MAASNSRTRTKRNRGKETYCQSTTPSLRMAEWAAGKTIRNVVDIHIYTVGFKRKAATGAGFFCKKTSCQGSFRFNAYNSVFQENVVGIFEGDKCEGPH